MEFAILGHLEQTSVRTLGHFLQGVLNSLELGLDNRVVAGLLVKSLEHFKRLVVSAAHNEPTRRLGQVADRSEDYDREEDLEREGEPPCNFLIANPSKSWVVPVSENIPYLGRRDRVNQP